jgi:hypothetical protein
MSNQMERSVDSVRMGDAADAFVSRVAVMNEKFKPSGIFNALCMGPVEELRGQYNAVEKLRQDILRGDHIVVPTALGEIADHLQIPAYRAYGQAWRAEYLRELLSQIEEQKWSEHYANLVTDEGANFILDTVWAGAGYTATVYMGLISSVNWTAVATTNTAAQINGANQWREAGPANAPNYSQGARPAMTFSSAAGRAKSLSTPCVFSMSQVGTLKGSFSATASTKQGTTGKLITAGQFLSGDRGVQIGDTINVSYTSSAA